MQGPRNPRGVAVALALEALLLAASLVMGFGDDTASGLPVWFVFVFGTVVATAGVVQSWLYSAGSVPPVLTSRGSVQPQSHPQPVTEELATARQVEVLINDEWQPALLDAWKTVHLGLYGRVQVDSARGPEWVEADRVRNVGPESVEPKPE